MKWYHFFCLWFLFWPWTTWDPLQEFKEFVRPTLQGRTQGQTQWLTQGRTQGRTQEQTQERTLWQKSKKRFSHPAALTIWWRVMQSNRITSSKCFCLTSFLCFFFLSIPLFFCPTECQIVCLLDFPPFVYMSVCLSLSDAVNLSVISPSVSLLR